jgi:uncharacterized membrane protein
MDSRRVALTALMTSLAIASAYATAAIPNVTLMDVVVFIAGWTMGAAAGATVGCFSWLVYGVLNPYGFNPLVWASTTICESLYGLAGGLTRRLLSPLSRAGLKEALLLGSLGFLATFTYDLFTNLAFAVAFNIPWLLAIALGVPFTLTHEVSNLAMFTFVAPSVARAVGMTLPRREVM